MPVPKTYAPEGGALASYTFTELIEGTGIIEFNGFSHNASGTETYTISTNSPYSNLISSSAAISVGNPYEIDFDTPQLNLPRNMKGTAYIQVPWRVVNSSSTNSNYVIARINKWDGTTETLIAQTSGAIKDSGSGGTSRVELLKIPITSVKHFKQGEYIRVTIGVDAASAGNSPKAHIGHDPQNRDGDYFPTSDTTQLKAWLPFKIDV